MFWPFLIALHKDPPVILWLFRSEALSNIHCWIIYFTEAQEAHRKKKNTTKDMVEYWSSFLQTAIKIFAERYKWDSLNWEWHDTKDVKKFCHHLLRLKYKKISGTLHNLFLRSKMSCHTVFPAGNTFLFQFRLDKFRSKNILRHVKHEDHFWFSLHCWSHWGRKTTQENNCHTSCHILKAPL